MRWPCFSRPRVGGPDPPQPDSSSSSDTPNDKSTNPPQFQDPGLARLFSDAASFGKILTSVTSRPDLVEGGSVAGDSRSANNTLNGFSQLVARDLNDSELAVSEKLAQLSVSNWDSAGSTTLTPDVDLGSEDSASDDEHDRPLPGGATQAAGEPDFEDRLTPDEILDLLQQEFGALAPPGEEKLLVETDASLVHDVVILVCLSTLVG
jgi:sterol 3beta-glucosyltransferase